MSFSGSFAKGTAICGETDVDFFLSLASNTPGTLKDLYTSLFQFVKQQGWNPRAQNVSVGVTNNGVKIDLVPGRKQAGSTTDHSLYRRKADTWTQTNVAEHIRVVTRSNRIDDICAVKIWRQFHGLDFPSIYLELTVLNALSGRGTNQPAANFLTCMHYLADNLMTARVVDPANSNNIISSDLTDAEKRKIAGQARRAVAEQLWNRILW
jgi:hypothetical protein